MRERNVVCPRFKDLEEQKRQLKKEKEKERGGGGEERIWQRCR